MPRGETGHRRKGASRVHQRRGGAMPRVSMMKVEEDGARRALQFMGTVDDLSLSANPELDIPDCPVVIACPCPAVIDDPRRYFSVAVFLVVSCRLGRNCRLGRACRRFRDLSISQRMISQRFAAISLRPPVLRRLSGRSFPSRDEQDADK
jgi:hypothetical protein